MTDYVGFFTDILDDLKTYLETEYPTYRIFYGPIAEAEFFSSGKPAISIQFEGGLDDPTMNLRWKWDVSVIYIKYDPKYTDDYTAVRDAETIMTAIHDHLTDQNIAGKRMYGDVTGMIPYRIPKDDSYVFAAQITASIQRKEEV